MHGLRTVLRWHLHGRPGRLLRNAPFLLFSMTRRRVDSIPKNPLQIMRCFACLLREIVIWPAYWKPFQNLTVIGLCTFDQYFHNRYIDYGVKYPPKFEDLFDWKTITNWNHLLYLINQVWHEYRTDSDITKVYFQGTIEKKAELRRSFLVDQTIDLIMGPQLSDEPRTRNLSR